MVARTINKALAGMEDLAVGVGQVTQQRGGNQVNVGKIDVPYALTNTLALEALDPALYPKAKVGLDVYMFSYTDFSGISSSIAAGSWIPVSGPLYSSSVLAGVNSTDVAYLSVGSIINTSVVCEEETGLTLVEWDGVPPSYTLVSYAKNSTGGYDLVLQDNLNNLVTYEYVTPYIRGLRNAGSVLGWGIKGDGVTLDNESLVAYSSFCANKGIPFNGNGLTFAVTNVSLLCGDYRDASFTPLSGHVGDGPTFNVNSLTGICRHENIKVKGFTNNGALISRNSFVGTASFVARGSNEYSGNGNLTRTLTTSEVDLSSDFVIPVEDSSIFDVNDSIWIGDANVTVLSKGTSSITLVNNGSSPTIIQGGTNTFKAGQYVTKDGNGKNGITIGDGGIGWNLDIAVGSIKANDNGWFGLFHYSSSFSGVQKIAGVEAERNGYIGIGLGYANVGYAKGCITRYNGNNGIDTLRSTTSFEFSGGTSKYNGVDGLFAGSNLAGELARVYSYDLRSNKRIGLLLNASTVAADYEVGSIDARDNDFRSVTLTGCGKGTISKVKFGGATYGSSGYLEGRNGCAGLQNHLLTDCVFYDNAGGNNDLDGNVNDYVNTIDGIVSLVNSFKADGSQISCEVINLNKVDSHSSPSTLVEFTASATNAVAGASVELAVRTYKVLSTSNPDVVGKLVKFSVFSSSSMSNQASLDAINRTAGVDVAEGSSLGQWAALTNFGVVTYNVSLSSSGSRYIVIEVEGVRKAVEITWS